MVNHSKKQTGGILLGMIIGLVIGLGIAVVVAVAITKTSLPFLNKSGKVEKPELTAGQIADPNRPMYGNKNAAKEAAKALAKEVEAKAAEAPSPMSEAKPDADKPKASVKPATVTVADPIDKAVTQKPDGGEDKSIYFLQAGAFREQADAESIKAKLALQGFEANISEKTSDNGPLYRVRLGPFNQIDAMNRVRRKLSDGGMDVAVVRIAK